MRDATSSAPNREMLPRTWAHVMEALLDRHNTNPITATLPVSAMLLPSKRVSHDPCHQSRVPARDSRRQPSPCENAHADKQMSQARRRTEPMGEHPDETQHDRELSKSESGQKKPGDSQRESVKAAMNSAPRAWAGLTAGRMPRRSTDGYRRASTHRPPQAQTPIWIRADEIDFSGQRRIWITIPELGRTGHQRQKQQAVKPIRRDGESMERTS